MPEKVSTLANGNVEILWDVEIEGKIRDNRPDITIKVKDATVWYFVDVTVLQDQRVVMKENEKVNKYLKLAEKAGAEHHVKVEIISIIIGAMGTIIKRLKSYSSTIEIPDIIGGAHTSLLIGAGRMLRNVRSL